MPTVRKILYSFALAATVGHAREADFTFVYTYPPAAARIAPLRKWLDADRTSLRAKVARDTAAERRDAAKDGYEFRPYDLQKTWAVVTETPAFLSLSSALYAYSGGAHGNTGSDAIIWDKRAARRLAPIDLFVSRTALETAIRKPYCAALDAERVRRVGAVNADSVFGACPQLKELTLLLGSRGRKAIDRIGLIADQYVAGSYAEGPYEITLPVTAAILATVRSQYRTAFALSR